MNRSISGTCFCVSTVPVSQVQKWVYLTHGLKRKPRPRDLVYILSFCLVCVLRSCLSCKVEMPKEISTARENCNCRNGCFACRKAHLFVAGEMSDCAKRRHDRASISKTIVLNLSKNTSLCVSPPSAPCQIDTICTTLFALFLIFPLVLVLPFSAFLQPIIKRNFPSPQCFASDHCHQDPSSAELGTQEVQEVTSCQVQTPTAPAFGEYAQ